MWYGEHLTRHDGGSLSSVIEDKRPYVERIVDALGARGGIVIAPDRQVSTRWWCDFHTGGPAAQFPKYKPRPTSKNNQKPHENLVFHAVSPLAKKLRRNERFRSATISLLMS